MRTEDDIRAAFRTLARQAPDADAVLADVTDRMDRTSANARQRAARGLRTPMAALASAVAVTAVIGASVALTIGGHARHSAAGPQNDAANDRPGPAGAPRYYLALVASGNPRSIIVRWHAVIKDTATSATLASVQPPKPFNTFVTLAGAGDDRTFVLAAQRIPDSRGTAPSMLFLARYDPSGRKITLRRLPVPTIPWNVRLNDVALSSSGSMLAVSTSAYKGGRSEQVSVYSTTSGAVKVWRQPGAASAYTLSFGPGGVLAYNWDGAPHHGVWLLNTAGAGGGLINDSRVAVTLPQGWAFADGALLSSDGSTVVAAEVRMTGNLRRHRANFQFAEFSATTGRLTRVILPQHAIPLVLFWTNPSGAALIVRAPVTGTRSLEVAVLRGTRLTRIPNAIALGGDMAF